MNMRIIGFCLLALCLDLCFSQKSTAECVMKNDNTEKDRVERTTRFESFVPAIITLNNGKKVINRQANILMTNSSLVYKKGWITMQAEMHNIRSVDIEGVHYDCIDTLLAEVVDSINGIKLYRSTMIDVEAYRGNIQNQQKVDNLEIGSFVNVNTVDLSSDDDRLYPLMYVYFFQIKGKFLKAHERILYRHLNAKQKRMLQILMEDPDFSFSKLYYMKKLLYEISLHS